MTYEELRDAIDGLHAYDNGSVDSGIHDESLRTRVQQHVSSLDETEARLTLSCIVRDLCLSDEALAQGYGWEDAQSLCRWIDQGFEP